jgi:peroxiredoxin
MSLEKSAYLKVKKGTQLPDFSLSGIDGKSHSPAEWKNARALLIVFMCNHCPYVIPKVAKLVELQKEYGPQGLQIIGINSNNNPDYPEDSFPKMKEFARTKKIDFPYLFDESQETAKAFDARCTPDPYLFDAEKKLVYHGRIDDRHGEPHSAAATNELEEAVKELLETGKCRVDENPSQGCSIKWN